MVTISRVIPNVWSALWNLGPQDPNQSELKTSEKDPSEGVTFLSHLSINFPRSVNPSVAGGVVHRTDTFLLS